MPEVASLPLKAMPTEWLYQPLASGPRLADAPVIVGGVASRLIPAESDADAPLLYVTVHVSVIPAVSLDTVLVSQPFVDVTPVGSQLKATVTLVVYQPSEQPPPLQETVIGGPALVAPAGRIKSSRDTASSKTRYRRPADPLPQ